MMKLWFEKAYPFVAGTLIAGLYFGFHEWLPFPKAIKELLNAAITIGAIAIGFLATMKAILLSIEDRDLIQRLRNSGKYQQLLGYMIGAVNWCFTATILSALGLLVDPAKYASWTPHAFAFWLLVASIAGVSFYRVLRIIYVILLYPERR